jgi:NTP pyrophosphatase (non-canonical NTP hydrolase)
MIGLCTESGEFQDMMKKHIFYGKEIDRVNLVEERGDIMYYIAMSCDVLNISLEEVMQKNADKLAARYKDGFSENKALNRDLDTEREILEK